MKTVTNKYLRMRLRQVVSQHSFKVMYTLLVLSVLQTLASSAIVAPALRLQHALATPGAADIIATIPFSFAAAAVWLTFFFGLDVMLLRMVRAEFVTFGFIFYGFKNARMALPAVLPFALAAALAFAALNGTLRAAVGGRLPDAETILETLRAASAAAESADANDAAAVLPRLMELLSVALTMLGIMLAFSVAAFLALVPFAFTFLFRADAPDAPVAAAVRKSLGILAHRTAYGQFLLLSLRSAAKPVGIATVCYVLSMFMPLRVLALLLDFASFFYIYTALINVLFVAPLMYAEVATAPGAENDGGAPRVLPPPPGGTEPAGDMNSAESSDSTDSANDAGAGAPGTEESC